MSDWPPPHFSASATVIRRPRKRLGQIRIVRHIFWVPDLSRPSPVGEHAEVSSPEQLRGVVIAFDSTFDGFAGFANILS